MRAQDVHLDFHTASELCAVSPKILSQRTKLNKEAGGAYNYTVLQTSRVASKVPKPRLDGSMGQLMGRRRVVQTQPSVF